MKLYKEKTICFSGHRNLPTNSYQYEKLWIDLYEEIEKAIKDGFDTFLMGACYGFDLLAAEMVLVQKTLIIKEQKRIKLIAAIPFKEQAAKWKEKDREKYFKILKQCDEVIYVNIQYSFNCYHKRNRFMVDNSSRLICYYDGGKSGTGYTVHYAKKMGCEEINLYK